MTFTHALSTNNYGPNKFIVATSAANGTHTTLASAMAAASSGDTIFLRDSVTENVTITPGVNIASLTSSTLNVPTIIGTLTMTGAGTSTVSGVNLQTNSATFLTVSGSAASIINLENCFLNCSNNTGISFTSSSASSSINIIKCRGDIGTTGITLFVSTASGSMLIENSHIKNSGVTTTASTSSVSIILLRYSDLTFPLSVTSTGAIDALFCSIQNVATTSITTAGTGTSTFHKCFISSGNQSCVSIGAGTIVALTNMDLNSSNTNVVTGAGTLTYTDLAFSGTSSVINPTTTSSTYTQLGSYKAALQPAFLAFLPSADANATGDGTSYTLGGTTALTEVYDIGGNFNTNGTFTAPVTGRYFLCACVLGQQAVATMTAQLNISTTLRNYTFGNYGTIGTGNWPMSFSTVADMTAGNTATVTLSFGNGTKVVDIYGAASPDLRTYFCGYLVS